MTEKSALSVRDLVRADKPEWAKLWEGYLRFYETSVPESLYDTYFERLLGSDPRDYSAIVVEHDGRLVGLAHFLFHRHGWKVENTCYLQDLFASPDMRGMGVGRALIEGVYARADAAGAPSVYWMTQQDNNQARQLYDRIGKVTPFIKYQRAA